MSVASAQSSHPSSGSGFAGEFVPNTAYSRFYVMWVVLAYGIASLSAALAGVVFAFRLPSSLGLVLIIVAVAVPALAYFLGPYHSPIPRYVSVDDLGIRLSAWKSRVSSSRLIPWSRVREIRPNPTVMRPGFTVTIGPGRPWLPRSEFFITVQVYQRFRHYIETRSGPAA
jgi:hypothetical protein